MSEPKDVDCQSSPCSECLKICLASGLYKVRENRKTGFLVSQVGYQQGEAARVCIRRVYERSGKWSRAFGCPSIFFDVCIPVTTNVRWTAVLAGLHVQRFYPRRHRLTEPTGL